VIVACAAACGATADRLGAAADWPCIAHRGRVYVSCSASCAAELLRQLAAAGRIAADPSPAVPAGQPGAG
jgi:hypothetical protein